MRNVPRKPGLNLALELLIEHVGFRDGKHPVLYEELWVVFFKLVQEYPVSVAYVVFVRRQHEQQYGIAFNMPEEAHSDALAFVSAFYYAGDVGHDERLVIIIADYAEVRLECRERVVRYLRPCRGYG